MSRPKSFRKVVGADLQTVQSNIEQAIAQAIRSPILNGVWIENVQLAAGNTSIPHKLGRNIKGWQIMDRSNAATIYRASKDDKFLVLNASIAVTVSLWVF